MKYFKFKLIGILAICILAIVSCSKESDLITDNLQNKQSTQIEARSVNQEVVNGMLYFDNYSDFEEYIDAIKIAEKDTTQITNAFEELGVDLSKELLPNLTFFPVALNQEEKIDEFTSARKIEETSINSAIEAGDESIISIIDEPYLKSALNQDYSVHIGTRIFTFYEAGGVSIVLNDNWDLYTSIKEIPFDQLNQSQDLFVTSKKYNHFERIYTLDNEGRPVAEIPYDIDDDIFAAPLFCDFSDQLVVTQLDDGNIRIDFPHSTPYDIYEWTFEDGTKSFDYPMLIDCSEQPTGYVILEIWTLCPECPSGKRRICWARVKFECSCGEKKSKKDRWESNNAGGSGKAIRIDASIWVKTGEIGCRSNLFGKGIFGIWFPLNWVMNTNGVCVDIEGSIKREQGTGDDKECIDVNIPLTTKCLQPGQSNGSIEQNLPQTGDIFCDPGNLSSGHRVRKLPGTWCGFGIDVPRLVLD